MCSVFCCCLLSVLVPFSFCSVMSFVGNEYVKEHVDVSFEGDEREVRREDGFEGGVSEEEG